MPCARPRTTGSSRASPLFLGVSVLSGLLVAGLVLPVVGGLGLVARDSADGFERAAR